MIEKAKKSDKKKRDRERKIDKTDRYFGKEKKRVGSLQHSLRAIETEKHRNRKKEREIETVE